MVVKSVSELNQTLSLTDGFEYFGSKPDIASSTAVTRELKDCGGVE